MLRAYALGCFNHPKLLRAHALECLVIQTRKMVPHAFCISCCRWSIVVVVVVGCRRCVIAWSMSSIKLLLLDEFNMFLSMIYIYILKYFAEYRVLDSIDGL